MNIFHAKPILTANGRQYCLDVSVSDNGRIATFSGLQVDVAPDNAFLGGGKVCIFDRPKKVRHVVQDGRHIWRDAIVEGASQALIRTETRI